MKLFVVGLVLLSFLHADEMQRIEAIVKDITDLRADYEKCKAELNSKNSQVMSAEISKDNKYEKEAKEYKKLYKKAKQKSVVLQAELDYANSSNDSDVKVVKIEEKYKKLLKIKENEIISLKKKLLYSKKTTKKITKVCDDLNEFPKLMLKKKYQKHEIIITNPTTYRLKIDSIIYSYIDGENINNWEVGTSFTSNQKTNNWVKITGYFVDKKWKSAESEMWIKARQVSKR